MCQYASVHVARCSSRSCRSHSICFECRPAEIELFSDTEHNVRLLEVIERGSDFERVTYEREK